MKIYFYGNNIPMNKHTIIVIVFLFTAFFANGNTIKGTVFDALTKQVVPNVYVQELLSGKAVVSNSNGQFSIDGIKDSAVIFCSHISYESQTIVLAELSKKYDVQVALMSKTCNLDDVEINATPIRYLTTKSYSHISIDEEIIESKIASSLIDVLQEVPGITKRGEYHSPIAIRGLGGKRILVTKDGNRRMGSFSSGFMGQGINIYDLKKIEVIKGPASVIYGPGAISGIINMESRFPFSTPGLKGRLLSSYGANNNEKHLLAGINWANLTHAFSFSGRYKTAGEYICGNGNVAQNSNYEDRDARLSYSWEGNNALRLTAESEIHLGGPWGRPVGFSGSDYITVSNKTDNTWHSSLTAVWNPEKTIKKMECSLYFDKENRNQLKDSYDVGTNKLSYREDVSYRNFYGGWRLLTTIKPSKKTDLKAGTDGVYYSIESPTTETDYFLKTIINNKVTKNASVAIAGLFAELEYISDNEKVKIRNGLRCDYANIHEGDVHDTLLDAGRASSMLSWSGVSSIVYKTDKEMFVSLQIARSCRIPDSKEMFIVTSGTDGMVYGNPDLVPECGLNVDAGLRGHLAFCAFDFSLFTNFLNDFVSLEYWKNSGKRGINFKYENIDKARIYGTELAYSMQLKHVLHPDNTIDYNGTAVYTVGDKLTDAPQWFSAGVPLRTIPPFNTSHELVFGRLFSSSLSGYISGDVRYYATQDRIAPAEDGGYVSPAYCLFGAGCGIIVKHQSIRWNFKCKIDNLANNNYFPLESLVYGMGRNIKCMAIISF